jgi:hypothetical protein
LLVGPSPGRAWGYGLYPLAPAGLGGWSWLEDVPEVPYFRVGTPAAEAAAHVAEHLLPLYRAQLAHARAARARREQARARDRAAVARMAEALGATEPRIHASNGSFHCRVTDSIAAGIQLPMDSNRIELHMSLPVDEAIALALVRSIQSGSVPSAAGGS